MKGSAKNTGEPGWKWRRMIIFPVVIYGCWQLRLLIDAPDTRVNEILASSWAMLVAALVLGYSSLATIQDVAAIWRTGTGLPYATPPVAIDGEPAPSADQPPMPGNYPQ